MVTLNGFNADEHVEDDFSPLPEGRYAVQIVESEMKATKAGTGSYLELSFRVIEGEHRGRLLWSRLNLTNPNETAVRIAKGELSAICRAVGVPRPKDSVELHNLPLTVTVRCKRREDTGEITNELKSYGPRETAGVPAQSDDATPPWARSKA